MHTYVKSKDEQFWIWTVGHYQMIGGTSSSSHQKWIPMKDFSTEEAAADYASYLNGGRRP